MYGLFTTVICAQLKARMILFRIFKKLKKITSPKIRTQKRSCILKKWMPYRINFVNRINFVSSQKKSQVSSKDPVDYENFFK